MKNATLRDVAAHAKISPASVSRYLNGTLRLPQPTVSRIEAAIAHLDYKPNAHARRLSLGRSDTIALVLPEIGNPFFAELAAAAEEAASERGLDVMLFATGNRLTRELDYLARLRRSDVDALIFVTNHADAEGKLAEAIGRSGRVVLLDEDVAGTTVTKVFSDNEAGGRLAARAFLEAGHRRLAYLGGPADLMSSIERGAGFHAAARDAGLGAEAIRMVCGDYSITHGRHAVETLLAEAEPPTAIFAASDQTLLGVLDGLRAHGLRVPRDVSVITFDDVAPLAFFDPPITAVRQSIGEMGRLGIERLARLVRRDEEPVETLRLPVELVSRDSVAPPRSLPR
jgi:LacI family transcriptional regulator